MNKRIYMSITDAKSMRKGLEKLTKYRDDVLKKTETLVSRLREVGIQTAYENSGQWRSVVYFKRDNIHIDETDVSCMIIGMDGTKVIKEWYTDKELTNKRSYEVSPLLLAEFGSGWLANISNWNVPGVGQGTMPNAEGHAFDRDGWWWYDTNGNKHHSYGEKPTYPMHAAMVAMMMEVDRIAREVFNG